MIISRRHSGGLTARPHRPAAWPPRRPAARPDGRLAGWVWQPPA